jgi:hypothetical protein
MARTGVDEELVAAQKAARSAARPSGAGVAPVGKVARPIDAPIELADDMAGELPNTPRRRVLEFDADEGSESSESPRRANNSAVLAMVAAALTLLLLTLVFILTTYAGKTPATPATIDTPVASEKPKRELEPLHLKAGVDDSPSANPQKVPVVSTLNSPKDDAGNRDLDTSSGTKAAVIAPDAIVEQPTVVVPTDPKVPSETPESEMPTAPVAPDAPVAPPVPAAPIAPAIPVAVAPLVMPTIAKWAAVSAFETVTVGSVQLRLRVDIGEGSGRTARFVPSKSLVSADVKITPSG